MKLSGPVVVVNLGKIVATLLPLAVLFWRRKRNTQSLNKQRIVSRCSHRHQKVRVVVETAIANHSPQLYHTSTDIPKEVDVRGGFDGWKRYCSGDTAFEEHGFLVIRQVTGEQLHTPFPSLYLTHIRRLCNLNGSSGVRIG